MFRLGVSGLHGCSPLHNSEFNPDDSAIRIAIKLITETILKLSECN